MTAVAIGRTAVRSPRLSAASVGVALVAVIGLVVGARWAAWRSGAIDPIAVGALFGAVLLALALAGGWRPSRGTSGPLAARVVARGLAGGLVLAVTALLGPHASWSGQLVGTFPLAPWAAATVLVASAEEALLRGALFGRLVEAHSAALAIIVTSVAFALMHVPVYGWAAAPLDLGVGLVLGGLRLISGGVAAPAIAHVIADLAVLAL
jgi:membrane protease YdiL (CAAX protease family)